MTDESFDPYRKWLGIPEKHQPPHHYRLLGIEVFEADPDVIESAANARMAHLRTFQNSKRAALSQQLLNEISTAKICLLDPKKRQDYDTELRQQLREKKQRKNKTTTPPPPKTSDAAEQFPFAEADTSPSANPIQVKAAKTPASSVARRRKKKNSTPLIIGGVGMGVILLLVVVIVAASKKSDKDVSGNGPPDNLTPIHQPKRDKSKPKDNTKPPPKFPVVPIKDSTKQPIPDPPRPGRRNIADATTEEVDLLSVVEVDEDTLIGKWVGDAGKSQLTAWGTDKTAVLQIPCKLPKFYELTLTLKRNSGIGAVAVTLVAGTQKTSLVLDQTTVKSVSGLEQVDGKPVRENGTVFEGKLFDKEARTIVCAVLDDRILVRCDDEEIVDWSGTFDQLSLPDRLKIGDDDQLTITVDKAEFGISELLVKQIADPSSYLKPSVDPPPVEVVKRLPVPDDDALAAAEEKLRQIYKKRADQAKLPSQKLSLAQQMLQDADDSSEAVTRYALLVMTGKFAATLGEAELAVLTAQRRADNYEVNVLDEKISLVIASREFAKFTPTKVKVARAAISVADEAAMADRYDDAIKLLKEAVDPILRDVVAKTASERLEAIQQMQQQHGEATAALAKLQDDPNDAESCSVAGRFFGLVKGDWQRAVPLLAKCDDVALKAAAEADLAQPTTADAQLAVADQWWALAKAYDSPHQENVQIRAYYWYRLALPNLDGDDKTRVETLLENAPATGDSANPVSNAPPSRLRGFETRQPQYRTSLLQKFGGSEKTELAVAEALKWLANHQADDGGWSYDHKVGNCTCGGSGKLTTARCGATAVALLAFLGAGHTHREGEYGDVIGDGLRFLAKHSNNGRISESDKDLFSHALGATAINEAYGMTRDRGWAQKANSTVQFTQTNQSAKDGSWGGETPLTSLHVIALGAANLANVKVDKRTLTGAVTWLDKMKYDDGGSYHFQLKNGKPDGGDATTTAMAALAHIYLGAKHDDTGVDKVVGQVLQDGPHSTNMTFNYFATQVLFHWGGDSWQQWNTQMIDGLLAKQAVAGHEVGSWHLGGKDKATENFGRLYHTAMATLILETYYRYPRVFDK